MSNYDVNLLSYVYTREKELVPLFLDYKNAIILGPWYKYQIMLILDELLEEFHGPLHNHLGYESNERTKEKLFAYLLKLY